MKNWRDIEFNLNHIEDNVYEVDFIKINQSMRLQSKPIIIGLGGRGLNLISYIENQNDTYFDFIGIGSDIKILKDSTINNTILLDNYLINNVQKYIKYADKINIVNGLGSGSSKYLIHLVNYCIANNISVNIICTTPFKWEIESRNKLSNDILLNLNNLNIEIKVFDNDNITNTSISNLNMSELFTLQDENIYKILCRDNESKLL